MRYFLAIIFPPAAVALCAGPGTILLNCLLTLCCVLPGMIHAVIVVADYKSNQRNRKLVAAIKRGR